MSSSFPASIDFCLDEFARHGGLTGPHDDGWGIAYYDEDGAVRLYKEAEPASESAWLRFIDEHNMLSRMVMSHIRLATQGEVSLKNTQPFRRELGGRFHLFTHNGNLDGFDRNPDHLIGSFRPTGDTDSEFAFCSLLGRLQPLWLEDSNTPELEARMEIVAGFAEAVRHFGVANFIYSDGDAVFVHGHMRRERADEEPKPPGLHVLHRVCGPEPNPFCAEGVSFSDRRGPSEMVIAASVPLTKEEDWQPLACGEVVALQNGRIALRR